MENLSEPKKQTDNQPKKLTYLNKIEKHGENECTVDKTRPKYFITFPYPYMNGKLHLGHLYTFSKADFTAYFKKLEGFNTLLPFAFHCTGMPISASAYKLSEELKGHKVDVSVAEILRGFGFRDLEPFTDPVHWIRTFPEYAIETLKKYGACIDWRRSFITTDINPYYDSFVRFQFGLLRKLGFLNFGKRYSIYCTIDNQACLDHDRRKGEGVKPVEAVLRKIPVQDGVLLVRCRSHREITKIVISRARAVDKIKIDGTTFYLEESLSKNLRHQIDNYELVGSDFPELSSKAVRIEYTDADIPMKVVHDEKSEREGGSAEYREIFERKNEKMHLVESASYAKIYEPESPVISRSGSTCVVSLLDQWFIDYGNEAWKVKARICAKKMEIDEEMRTKLLASIDWINKWGFSRSFGLGTKIPWDPQYLIESLSDSTIYMAFYTVKHLLYSGLDGKNEIFPVALLSDCFWAYIFSDVLECGEPVVLDGALLKYKDILDACRESLGYFYPVDLRVSAKDLVTNHLTFFIFNHVALFKEEFWPKKIFTNGYVMLNSAKMSKSDGNFLSGEDALERYGASATRMALALCGDTNEDANFEESVANACVLKLHTLVKSVEALDTEVPDIKSLNISDSKCAADSKSPANDGKFVDSWFVSQISANAKTTIESYREMLFRNVVKYGFYENLHAIELYSLLGGTNSSLVKYAYKSVLQILYPIVPGISRYLLDLKFNSEICLPVIGEIDDGKIEAIQHLKTVCKQLIGSSKGKKRVEITINKEYPVWKRRCMRIVDDLKKKVYNDKELKNVIIKEVEPILDGVSTVNKKKGVLFCMDYLKDPGSYEIKFDEYAVFVLFRRYLEDVTKLVVEVKAGADEGEPMSPQFKFD